MSKNNPLCLQIYQESSYLSHELCNITLFATITQVLVFVPMHYYPKILIIRYGNIHIISNQKKKGVSSSFT